VLHFAPDRSISDLLATFDGIDCVTADLDPGIAEQQIDITCIPYPAASFDLILLSHVLEHVPDDAKALAELHRVLRPGGRLVMQHPIDYQRPETYEDFSLQSAEERRAHFGQEDHVRLYGRDFPDRVRSAGFDVEMVRYGQALDPARRARYGLLDHESPFRADDIYLCTKS
jgi:SAM-dependent methyltransferase